MMLADAFRCFAKRSIAGMEKAEMPSCRELQEKRRAGEYTRRGDETRIPGF